MENLHDTQKILREKHKIDVWVKPFVVLKNKEYLGYVIFTPNRDEDGKIITHKTYEEALEHGIKYAFELLKK